MATVSHSPDSFLIKLSPDLLKKYSKKHKIEYKHNEDLKAEENIEQFMAQLKAYDEKLQHAFWLGLFDIDEIGTRNGCNYLMEQVTEAEEVLGEEFLKLTNNKQRALYYYLNHPEIFENAFDDYCIENLVGWKTILVPQKNKESVIARLNQFQLGLKDLYNKEHRGENLKVKFNVNEERVAFTAFVEDALQNDIIFQKGDLELHIPRKPVIRIYFIYRPAEGTLDVKAKGGWKVIEKLNRIFLDTILDSPEWEIQPNRFNFSMFQDINNLELATEIQDGIEQVTLKGLQLTDQSYSRSLNIEISSKAENGIEPMRKTLQKLGINLAYYTIQRCKIEFIFRKFGNQRRKKVTVTIGQPNYCNLKERAQDLKVREMLKRWRIDQF